MHVHLAIGSNLGERRANLRAAVAAVAALDDTTLVTTSRAYETEPIGVEGQPAFLNAAVAIDTDLEPHDLLREVKRIESELGRAPGERWGPRVIDIDIILWGDHVVESETLTIPHAEFRSRQFVLAPLSEIAPDAIDPVTRATVAELAESTGTEGAVIRIMDL